MGLDGMWRVAVDHPIAVRWRANADHAYKFRQGEQWFPAESSALRQRGQPEVVENEIHPILERLKGQFRRQRTTIKFVGRNLPDDGIASLQTDILRHIDSVNHFEFVEGDAVDDQLIGGIGVVEIGVRPNEMGQTSVFYRYEDPFGIFLDPYSRAYDWNDDARFLCRSKWIDLDEAQALWPEKAGLLAQCIGIAYPGSARALMDPDVLKDRQLMDHYFDSQRQRLRPVEIWYKKRAVKRVIKTAGGALVDTEGLNAKEQQSVIEGFEGTVLDEQTIMEMWVAVFCGGVMIQTPKKSPYKNHLFPFVPYFAYRKKDGEPYGYISQLISPQREINARRSKALYALNNRQAIYEENAIKDKKLLADELALSDGQIEVRAGKFDRFAIRENADITQGNLSMLQEAKQSMRRISGEDQLNPAPEMRSGVGVQRLQMIHQNGIIPLFDNIRRSRRIKAKLVYELVKAFYTEEMIFQITDDPGIARQVRVTGSHFDSIKARTYDLIAVDAQDYLTSQAEQLETLTTTLPQVIPLGAGWAKLLISMSDLRNKDGLLQMIDQMSQAPPPEPKFSLSLQWNELTSQEKIAWAMKLGMPELAQAVQSAPTQPGHITQNQSEVLKMKMKTDADVKAALISHDSTGRTQELEMQKDAMKGLAQLRMQERDQAHEMALAQQEATREQGNPSAP